ncbi:hypothetical protein GWI33_000118 [Rhynchophorus ferrugineus]|uniref:Uncharacterized protein n=1 Tax=Rhynchophorus ferrugineus TaxID=354439 RepID=A0A834IX60_RHYFE|nr:hypothetical protein GWI33_000118 [Rhynchophorus ferrugineus]
MVDSTMTSETSHISLTSDATKFDYTITSLNHDVFSEINKTVCDHKTNKIRKLMGGIPDQLDICWYHKSYQQKARKCVPSCTYSRKLKGTSVNAAYRIPNTPRRLNIIDRKQNITFLVNTEAELTIVPRNKYIGAYNSNFNLFSAKGSKIATYGTIKLSLKFGLERTFDWVFVIADVMDPILGADFLSHFEIQVDIRYQNLIDPSNQTFTRCNRTATKIIVKFPNVIRPLKDCINTDIMHRIKTRAPTTHARTRRLAPYKLNYLRQEKKNLRDEILRQLSYSWSSPVHMVEKKDGSWRIS